VLLLVALALVLRSIQYRLTYLLFTDTAHYVDMARMLARGDLEGVIRHEYHPLFAVVIAAASWVVPDDVTAARIVTVLAGSLGVVPIAILFRRFGGPWIGLPAAAGYAFAPYPLRYAAAGNAEALYFPIFFTAVALGLRSLERDDVGAALGCAFASGLAFLVRPEGAGVFGVVLALMVLRIPGRLHRGEPLGLRPLAACAALFLLVGGAYLAYEYGTTGRFDLSAKKSIVALLGLGEDPRAETIAAYNDLDEDRGPIAIAVVVFNRITSVMGGPLAALALLGFLVGPPKGVVLLERGRPKDRRRRRFGAAELQILALFVVYALVLALLFRAYGYVSRRHAAAVSLLTLGWAAWGAWSARDAIAVGVGRLGADDRRARSLATLALSILLLTLFVTKALKPEGRDQQAIRRAGEWMAAHLEGTGEADASVRLVVPLKWSDPRIPIYAGLSIDQPMLESSADLFSYLQGVGAGYLAVIDTLVDRRGVGHLFFEDPRLEVLHRERFGPDGRETEAATDEAAGDEEGRSVWIFRFRPASD
jgi:4-amino-4-deoxy-L-arabinose transferase-like glycosyltransferase